MSSLLPHLVRLNFINSFFLYRFAFLEGSARAEIEFSVIVHTLKFVFFITISDAHYTEIEIVRHPNTLFCFQLSTYDAFLSFSGQKFRKSVQSSIASR